jgi:hypothetical protein
MTTNMTTGDDDKTMATKRRVMVHGRERWEVDFGVDALVGKKKRSYFETEKEADDAVAGYEREVKKGGEYWARMSPAKRQWVIGILMDIEAKGQSIQSVWADWQRDKKAATQTIIPQPYEDCVTEWKRRKLAAGKTERYVYHAAVDLMKFGRGQERRNIHEIRADELERYIDSQRIQKRGPQFGQKWGLSTRRTNMSLFSSLWEVAIAKGWATLNIVDRLEPVGKLGRQKRIYSNETTLNLMAAAMSNAKTQTVIAPLALGFFGCMRPEEIASEKPKEKGLPVEKWFGWKDIDLEHGLVSVSTDVAKTGDERVIRLQPTALQWLKLAKELGNPLPPVNELRTVNLCCEMIGLDDWIRDGLRKNCATHLRVIYKNDYEVVKDMGNSVRILLRAYAELRTPEAVSLEHWMITPGKVKEYMKSRAWGTVLREAAEKAERKAAAAIEASEKQPKQKTSGADKSGS